MTLIGFARYSFSDGRGERSGLMLYCTEPIVNNREMIGEGLRSRSIKIPDYNFKIDPALIGKDIKILEERYGYNESKVVGIMSESDYNKFMSK